MSSYESIDVPKFCMVFPLKMIEHILKSTYRMSVVNVIITTRTYSMIVPVVSNCNIRIGGYNQCYSNQLLRISYWLEHRLRNMQNSIANI